MRPDPRTYDDRLSQSAELVRLGITSRRAIAEYLGIEHATLSMFLYARAARGDERAAYVLKGTSARLVRGTYARTAGRLDECLDLIDDGITDRTVMASRLGISSDALERYLYRHKSDPRTQRIKQLTHTRKDRSHAAAK